MSCNTKTSLAAVIDAVNAQLNNNYVDRDDPRIDQGVFTEPTIRGGLMLDEAAKLDFCGYVTECGQREPFGKQWVDRPLYPYNTLVSYEDGGEIKSHWQDIDDVIEGSLPLRTINKGLESIADLPTVENPIDGLRVYVKSYHEGLHKGGGFFTYNSDKVTDNNGGTVFNGWVRDIAQNYLNTYHFGAIADGTFHEEDNRSFQYISAVVNNSTPDQKSFKIHVEAGDYVVGIEKELNSLSPLGIHAEPVLEISFNEFQTKHIIVQCDSAYIKLRDGMRYGTFLKETQEPYDPKEMPFYNSNHPEFAEMKNSITICNLPYVFHFKNFSNLVIKGEVDIDLNSGNQIIGGRYGDTGHQVICYGLRVRDIQVFDIENVYTHDSCLDGVAISSYFPLDEGEKLLPETSGVLRNVKSYRNGRQGLSFTGGQNVSFYDCAFYDMAIPELPVQSNPGSCFDLEAEGGKKNRNIRFFNCYFGQGRSSFVADSGDSKGVHFENCIFINGSTALWCNKKNISFNNCIIKGRMVNMYGSSLDPKENVRISNSLITDDTDISADPLQDSSYLMSIYGGITFENTTFSIGNTKLGTNKKEVEGVILRPVFDNCTIVIREGYVGENHALSYLDGFVNWVDLRKPTEDGVPVSTLFANTYFNTATHVIRKQSRSGSLGYITDVIVDTNWASENNYLKPQSLQVIPYIEKSTEETDTAVKLNSLIDSLNTAGLVLPEI